MTGIRPSEMSSLRDGDLSVVTKRLILAPPRILLAGFELLGRVATLARSTFFGRLSAGSDYVGSVRTAIFIRSMQRR